MTAISPLFGRLENAYHSNTHAYKNNIIEERDIYQVLHMLFPCNFQFGSTCYSVSTTYTLHFRGSWQPWFFPASYSACDSCGGNPSFRLSMTVCYSYGFVPLCGSLLPLLYFTITSMTSAAKSHDQGRFS